MENVKSHRDGGYGANRNKVTQMIFAGFMGSLAMMALAYLLPLIGIPSQDFSALYGALFNGAVAPYAFSGSWWAGLFTHLVLGSVVWSLAYDYLIDRRVLPNRPRLKGLLWGAALWCLVEALVKPMSGDGFFSTNMPYPSLISVISLVCWLVYGLVLEQMTRMRVVHEMAMHQHPRRAA